MKASEENEEVVQYGLFDIDLKEINSLYPGGRTEFLQNIRKLPHVSDACWVYLNLSKGPYKDPSPMDINFDKILVTVRGSDHPEVYETFLTIYRLKGITNRHAFIRGTNSR